MDTGTTLSSVVEEELLQSGLKRRFKFSTRNQRLIKRKRLGSSHGQTFSCDLCDYVVTDKCALVQHINIHTGEKPYKCHLCDARYANSGTLHRHLQRHAKFTYFECATCGKEFYSKGDLTRHIKSHEGIKDFCCEHCSLCFTRKHSLKVHIFRVHHGVGESPYQKKKERVFCRVCKKTYHKDSMRNHMRIHTKEKPFTCPHCPKCFRDYSTLTQHLRMHTESGEYFCRRCKLVFDSKRALSCHFKMEEHRKAVKSNDGIPQEKNLRTKVLKYNINKLSTRSAEQGDSADHLPPAECCQKNLEEGMEDSSQRILRTRHKRVSYNEDDDIVIAHPSRKKKKKISKMHGNKQGDSRGTKIWKANLGLTNAVVGCSHPQKVNPVLKSVQPKIPDSSTQIYPWKEEFENVPVLEKHRSWCEGSEIKSEADVSEHYFVPDLEDVKIEKYEDDLERKDETLLDLEQLKGDQLAVDIKEEKMDCVLNDTDIWQLL